MKAGSRLQRGNHHYIGLEMLIRGDVRAIRILGASFSAVLGTQACIYATHHTLPREEDQATVALARANELLMKGEADRAITIAKGALARARGHADVSQKSIAKLTEVVAQSSFTNRSADAPDQFAAALSAWESVPNADEDVARVSALEGLALVFMHDDLAKAERLYRRAIAILERLHGASDPALIMSLHYLLDVLDQECRIAEYRIALAQLERIYDLHPGQECASFYRRRFHALAMRREGDIEGGFALMQQAIAELEKSEIEAHTPQSELKRAAYEFLGNIARDGGRYAEAMRVDELRSAVHVDTAHAELHQSYALLSSHFDYEAAGDARLLTLDEEFGIRSAHSGEPLFAASLSTIESCQPETGPDPHGWVFRASEADGLIAPCFEATTAPNAHVSVMMRVEAGAIVAAEAAGINVEPATLACASHAVVALKIPGPHDFNFDDWHWDFGR